METIDFMLRIAVGLAMGLSVWHMLEDDIQLASYFLLWAIVMLLIEVI